MAKDWYMEVFIGDLSPDGEYWQRCMDTYAATGGDINNKNAYNKSGFGSSHWNKSGKKARRRGSNRVRDGSRRRPPHPATDLCVSERT